MSIAGQTQYCTNGRSFDSNYITSTLDILKKNVEQLHNEIEKKAAPYIDLYGRAQECHQKIEIVLQKYQDIFPSTFFQRLKSRVQDVLCRRIGYMTSYIQHHHVKTQIEKRQRSVSLLISRLTLHSEEIEIQKKWRKLGLPDAVLVQAPQLAKFLYKTGDMFSFIGFSQGQKAEKAAFQTKDDGSVAILYKGEYVDINYFSSCVQYDTAKNQLILKDSQTPLLYVAPDPSSFV